VQHDLRLLIDDQPVTETALLALERVAVAPESSFDANALASPFFRDATGESTGATPEQLQRFNDAEMALGAQRMVDALTTLADRLAVRRGMKALVLLSDGWSLGAPALNGLGGM